MTCLFKTEDPNMRFNVYIINRHLPKKKMNRKEIKLKKKPWITSEILKKIKHRNDLFAIKKSNPGDDYIRHAYNRFRHSVIRDIKHSKKTYY